MCTCTFLILFPQVRVQWDLVAQWASRVAATGLKALEAKATADMDRGISMAMGRKATEAPSRVTATDLRATVAKVTGRKATAAAATDLRATVVTDMDPKAMAVITTVTSPKGTAAKAMAVITTDPKDTVERDASRNPKAMLALKAMPVAKATAERSPRSKNPRKQTLPPSK